MVPIVINKNRPFDDDSFRDYLLNICKTHQEQNRALAFAFIVYDFYDYTVSKILDDTHYWSSLDKISGKYLSVFYINTNDEYYKRRQKEIYNDETMQRINNSRKGNISFFVPITLKPTPLDKATQFVKNEFELDDNLKTPFVLFFQTNGEIILDYLIVSLKQEKLEDAFLELKAHIQNAVASLTDVTPDNYNNHQEIFDLLKTGIKSSKFFTFINKKVISKLTIGTIISLVKLIAGH